MEEPAFEKGLMPTTRVAIWGLGLMGGSLAMALKGKVAELVGIDVDPGTIKRALDLGIVDQASTQPSEVIQNTDLIVLSVPVRAILDLLPLLPEICSGSAVVLDLGSTKREIMAAMSHLPERFIPVGGHPMCGKEKSSLEFAEATLFFEAPFALTAIDRTTPYGRGLVEEVVRSVGANPLWLNADDHDRIVAATSHAPFLLASALAFSTPINASPLVGPGFRSTARLAGSSTGMMIDILMTNAENVRDALDQFKVVLGQFEMLLEQGDGQRLTNYLEQSADRYRYLSGGR